MDEYGESFESQHNKNKRVMRGHDRIGELPEEIIIFILSLLPVKEAAATSLLSRRWSNLWKQTHILNFNSKIPLSNNPTRWDADRCKYVKLVNSVLQSHKSLFLKRFKISFYVNKSAQPHVEKWFDFLFSRRVDNVDLDFKCFKCFKENLKKVVLKDYLLKQEGLSHIVMFKSLRRLSLKCFQLSGEDIKVFLHNCPLLNVLIINAATLMSDVEIRGGENLKLKVLEIYASVGRKLIKVSAPNLTWIRVDDSNFPGKLVFENTGKVFRAGFMVRKPRCLPHHFASQLACFISQLRHLTLSLYHPKEFLGKEFPRMPKLKRLFVEYSGDYDHGGFLHLAALIWASPLLQEFHLKFKGEYKDSTSQQMEVEEAMVKVERRRHRNLKTFKLRGSCVGMSDQVVKLVRCISKKCIKLEKIIIGRTLMVSPDIKAEVKARDDIKLQLQPILRRRIQLQISEPI